MTTLSNVGPTTSVALARFARAAFLIVPAAESYPNDSLAGSRTSTFNHRKRES
jgi:hypothetical protein